MEQNANRKGRIDEKTLQLAFEDNGQSEEYKVKAIFDSAVYARELGSCHRPRLYYGIYWKGFPDEENT